MFRQTYYYPFCEILMTNDSKTLVKDWEALLKQAKEMQHALDKFVFYLSAFLYAAFLYFPRSTGFANTSSWGGILKRTNHQSLSNFTRYAARSIELHLFNNRTT